jgi:MoxR-like ATPase
MGQNSDQPAYLLRPEVDLIGFKATADAMRANIARVIVGQAATIDLVLAALFSEGHVLIEDVPGTGKTMLARALARSIDGAFQRIQCTPDLLPGDITGISYFNQKTGEFEFRPGPILAQIVLADEVNRATPRTQSALLEAMAERQVTVERETITLPRPFMLIATQNPVELAGTFPLPEAQLDRFLIRVHMEYPSKQEERDILRRYRDASPLESLQPVATTEAVMQSIATTRQIFMDPSIEDYLIAVVQATRQMTDRVELGVSPRGALALARACQARAAMDGRTFVLPDDVKRLAVPVLAHRLITTSETEHLREAAEAAIREAIQHVPTPAEQLR